MRDRGTGRRPGISDARQYPYPSQTGKRRTEMGPGGSLFTEIYSGGI
jgi:hypothetical protein